MAGPPPRRRTGHAGPSSPALVVDNRLIGSRLRRILTAAGRLLAGHRGIKPGNNRFFRAAVVNTAPTLGLDALACTRTAVPQALQKAACSSSGISHCAQYWTSRRGPVPPSRTRPLQSGLHQADMQHIANPQDQDRQDDEAPEDAQDHAERRVSDEGEQVGAGLVGGIGQDGLADPRK